MRRALPLPLARVSTIGWKSLRDPADRFPTIPPTTVTGFLSNPFFASSSIFPLPPLAAPSLLCFPYKIRDDLVRATRRTCAYASRWTTTWKRGRGMKRNVELRKTRSTLYVRPNDEGLMLIVCDIQEWWEENLEGKREREQFLMNSFLTD